MSVLQAAASIIDASRGPFAFPLDFARGSGSGKGRRKGMARHSEPSREIQPSTSSFPLAIHP